MNAPRHIAASPSGTPRNPAGLLFLGMSLVSLVAFVYSSLAGDAAKGLALPLNQPLMLAFAVVAAWAAILARLLGGFELPSRQFVLGQLLFAGAWFLLLLQALFRGFALSDCVVLYGPVVAAILFHTNMRMLAGILAALGVISLSIQAYEFINGRYLFVIVSWGEWLDEDLNSGTLGFLRAKGLFASPTNTAAFAILCFCFIRRARWLLVVLLATAIFTAARTAFVFIMIYGAIYFLMLPTARKLELLPFVLGGSLVAATLLAGATLAGRIGRLVQLNPFGDSANVSRVGYWLDSLSLFERFGTVEKVLGAPRESQRVWYGATESQPLQYLIDTGFIGITLFFLGLAFTAWFLRKADPHTCAAFVAVNAISLVTPLYNQAGMNILFWLYIFRLWSDHMSYAAAPRLSRRRERSASAGWQMTEPYLGSGERYIRPRTTRVNG